MFKINFANQPTPTPTPQPAPLFRVRFSNILQKEMEKHAIEQDRQLQPAPAIPPTQPNYNHRQPMTIYSTASISQKKTHSTLQHVSAHSPDAQFSK